MALTVSEAELKAAIRYMKLDDVVEADPEEAQVAKDCYLAAVIYLKNGGAVKPEEDPELYYLAVKSLCLHYYDHRDAIGDPEAIPKGLRLIINQLKQDGELSAVYK